MLLRLLSVCYNLLSLTFYFSGYLSRKALEYNILYVLRDMIEDKAKISLNLKLKCLFPGMVLCPLSMVSKF